MQMRESKSRALVPHSAFFIIFHSYLRPDLAFEFILVARLAAVTLFL